MWSLAEALFTPQVRFVRPLHSLFQLSLPQQAQTLPIWSAGSIHVSAPAGMATASRARVYRSPQCN